MRALWLKFRYRCEYTLFWIAARIFSTLPVDTGADLSAFLCRIIAPRLKRHPRALNNLRLAFPQKSPAELEIIARDMWAGIGRTFAESFHLALLSSPARYEVENEGELREALQDNAGCVFCAPHCSNWELVAAGALLLGFNTTGVYQKISNPLVDKRVREMRAFLYPAGLYPKGPVAARAMMRHASQGGVVGMLADRRDDDGVTVPFFGRPAPSTPFPALLARRYAMPLLACRIVRDPGPRFRLRVHRIDVPRTDDRDDDVKVATTRMQAVFESWISESPQQWTWSHRRWSKPDG
jgi:KDO2-lipid IV(A) lauroyltransferase